MEQSEYLVAHGRDLLGMVLYEPRGHAAMCGAILTDPMTPGADVGVLFIEPLGPVHMCGHGAIALGAMLVETGRVAAPGGDATVTLDTPAGLVACRVSSRAGQPTAVTIRNVPAFSVGLDLHVDVPGLGRVAFDLAYGGHFYALVEAAACGLTLEAKEAGRLVEIGERIRLAIEARVPLVHPAMPAARGLLYVQFYGPARRADAQLRNAVVVAPAGLDRSPCGTGTSARLANLHARGAARRGGDLRPRVHHRHALHRANRGAHRGGGDPGGGPGDHRTSLDDVPRHPLARSQRSLSRRLPALTVPRVGAFIDTSAGPVLSWIG